MYPTNMGRRTSIPHNTYPNSDLFLQSLERRFGNDGYAFYFKMQELIFRNPQAEISLDLFNSYSLLADMVGVDENVFVDMLEFALTEGFFDRKIYERRNVLTSFAFKQATFDMARPDYSHSSKPLSMVETEMENKGSNCDSEYVPEPSFKKNIRTSRVSNVGEQMKMANSRIHTQWSQEEDKESIGQRLSQFLPKKQVRLQTGEWKDRLHKPKIPKLKFKIPISKLKAISTKAKDFFLRDDEEFEDERDNKKQ